jgi:hypothetical protein
MDCNNFFELGILSVLGGIFKVKRECHRRLSYRTGKNLAKGVHINGFISVHGVLIFWERGSKI